VKISQIIDHWYRDTIDALVIWSLEKWAG